MPFDRQGRDSTRPAHGVLVCRHVHFSEVCVLGSLYPETNKVVIRLNDEGRRVRRVPNQTPKRTPVKFAPYTPLGTVFRKPSIPARTKVSVMSLFPGGSAQPEPLLGRQAGASSHLQATVPTLLQALSAGESTAPHLVRKASPVSPGSNWLVGRGWPKARAACGVVCR